MGENGGRHFSGGQDPQKVIGFDHFVQENAHFFLISLKVGGPDNFFGGQMPPLSSPGASTGTVLQACFLYKYVIKVLTKTVNVNFSESYFELN